MSRILLRVLVLAIGASLMRPAPARAQSQGLNGTIEGTITDASGGVLPGVSVTVHNSDTGAERTVVSNDRGLYRAPLLQLGSYLVSAELSGFKKYERSGVLLTAGSTVVINATLEVGAVEQVVSVTAESPVIDIGKIDLGRNLTEREIHNLPLVSRNPYNYALLQPGVTGFENSEFGVPRFSANGSLLRINYQMDGNTNTQKDRAGLRLLPMSEIMISEVKVVTSGYAPEFGQTMGLVYNAITPSGTNAVKGHGSYRFRRTAFSAFPFFFTLPRTDANKPQDKVDTVTGAVGGPLIKDKLHYYGGYERTYRDMVRVITADPAVVQQLGLPTQPGAVPAYQSVNFYLGKVDYTINPTHRLSARVNVFQNNNPFNGGGGGLTLLERSFDFFDRMKSLSSQVVSTWGANRLNELRLQYAERHQVRASHEGAPAGITVNITNGVSFGAPTSNGEDFVQGITQVIDNFTLIHGNHSFKQGFDFQYVHDTRGVPLTSTYSFPSVDAYLQAKTGANPFGFTTFAQVLGDPNFAMNTRMFSLFWQDDWRLSADLKLLYGVRYDIYDPPGANAQSPFSFSQNFSVDRNNIAPRLGVAWTIGDSKRTVLRASTGLMYDQPLLAIYEQAIQQNGLPARTTVSVSGTAARTSPSGPAFPGTLSNLPAGFTLPAQTIFAPDPDLTVGSAVQNSVQIEREIARRYSASLGFVYNRGSHLPSINNVNLINPIGTLADGRGIFNTVPSATSRMDTRFNQINVVQSFGDSTYKAFIFTFDRRSPTGLGFDVNYTYGKGLDNAPLTGTLAVQGDDGRSDPANLERDRGPNALDTRHSFNGSVVAMSKWTHGPAALQKILSDNQASILLQFNSGIPVSVRSNLDLNGDGSTGNDRLLFLGRNSLYLPNRWNTDARLSRFVGVGGSRRLEVLAEFKNIFNTVQTSSINRTVTTDAQGNPVLPIRFGTTITALTAVPTDATLFPATGGYEQRKFQLGFKLTF